MKQGKWLIVAMALAMGLGFAVQSASANGLDNPYDQKLLNAGMTPVGDAETAIVGVDGRVYVDAEEPPICCIYMDGKKAPSTRTACQAAGGHPFEGDIQNNCETSKNVPKP